LGRRPAPRRSPASLSQGRSKLADAFAANVRRDIALTTAGLGGRAAQFGNAEID